MRRYYEQRPILARRVKPPNIVVAGAAGHHRRLSLPTVVHVASSTIPDIRRERNVSIILKVSRHGLFGVQRAVEVEIERGKVGLAQALSERIKDGNIHYGPFSRGKEFL